jgi:glucose/arabinose dehydrogenase
MRHTSVLRSVALVSWFASAEASAAVSAPGFTESVFVSSWDVFGATGMAWAPDGSQRLFVARQEGDIRIIKNGEVLPVPFATLNPIHTAGESGLLGIAFDPNFLASKHVYVFATVSPTEQQIIRYTVSGDLGTGKTVIVAGLPTQGQNHNGGAIGFGLDGKLYWAIGDNADGDESSVGLSSLKAKVGRVNPDGSVPSDNPFFDGGGPNADHIWARGFRNPFTCAFQPSTGLLWVASVGDLYEQIFIVRRGDDAGWPFHENNQPAGFLAPAIKYRTNDVDTLAIRSAAMAGAVRANGIVTFSTTLPHGFRQGEKITVSGVGDAGFNGTFPVASLPDATTFTVVQAGPGAQSGGGTAATHYQGGSVTGGAFYTATQFPAAYRGNLFYGDYNSNQLMRATLDPGTNAISSIDQWGTGPAGQVDIAVGPDGALYYHGHGSLEIYRASHDASVQGLVASPTVLWTAEGQAVALTVRLQRPPAGNVSVSGARVSGDSDVVVSAGAALTFTSVNWATPQLVTVTALHDTDTLEDTATLAVSSAGLAPETISVRARDLMTSAAAKSVSTLSPATRVLAAAALALLGGWTLARRKRRA